MGLKVINKSPEKVDMVEQVAFSTLTYKEDLSYNGDSTIVVEIVDENNDIKELKVMPTCGCTVSDTTKNDNVYTVRIVYDTTRRGSFTKQLQIIFKEGGSTKKNFITIKGRVV